MADTDKVLGTKALKPAALLLLAPPIAGYLIGGTKGAIIGTGLIAGIIGLAVTSANR